MRLVDAVCHVCKKVYEDVWDDEMSCDSCGGALELTWLHAPGMDVHFTEPITVPTLEGRFETSRKLDRYLKSSGKALVTQNEWEALPRKSTEERINSRLAPARREAIRKSMYRLRYGYKDSQTPDVKEAHDA